MAEFEEGEGVAGWRTWMFRCLPVWPVHNDTFQFAECFRKFVATCTKMYSKCDDVNHMNCLIVALKVVTKWKRDQFS